ncbi:hypothetical protein [Arthrobacter sp. D2-10]
MLDLSRDVKDDVALLPSSVDVAVRVDDVGEVEGSVNDRAKLPRF